MNKDTLMKTGVAAAILFATYKFVPNAAVRAAILGVAGVMAVRNIPFVNQYVVV